MGPFRCPCAIAANYIIPSCRCQALRRREIHRRNWGEIVENVAGIDECHWMAGNFLKYAGPLNWHDLPVDSHELIAMWAPRGSRAARSHPRQRRKSILGPPRQPLCPCRLCQRHQERHSGKHQPPFKHRDHRSTGSGAIQRPPRRQPR
jgi:hypothetical protein